MDGSMSPALTQMLKGYCVADPPTKQQAAIPPSILKEAYTSTTSSREKQHATLLIGAFFYRCWSCEYLQVNGIRKMMMITVLDIQFFKNNREINHEKGTQTRVLMVANVVMVTFWLQKNDEKYTKIPMHRTSCPTLCLVKAWTRIIFHLCQQKFSHDRTLVFAYWQNDQSMKPFAVEETVKYLQQLVQKFGSGRIGILPEDIGTHPIQSSFAMALILGGTPVFEVMLVGWWASDAFIRYIQSQVLDFSKGISDKMIKNNNYFCVPQQEVLWPRCWDELHLGNSITLRNKWCIQPHFHIYG